MLLTPALHQYQYKSVTSIREGSSLYYSLLWLTDDTRNRVVNRLGLTQALSTSLEDVQETQVAERKIHWWHEELERMVKGEARHPATQACQDCFDTTERSNQANSVQAHPALAACMSILSVASNDSFSPPATEADAALSLTQGFQARLALLTHALSQDITELDAGSQPAPAALALAKHDRLIRLPQLIHRGHAVFSEDTFQRHAIRPSDLAQHIRVARTSNANDKSPESSTLGGIPLTIDKPGRKELLMEAIQDTHDALQIALSTQNVENRYRVKHLQPVWRYLVLCEKQLALWVRTQPDLLRERSTLTPIRKFYWSWRHRR